MGTTGIHCFLPAAEFCRKPIQVKVVLIDLNLKRVRKIIMTIEKLYCTIFQVIFSVTPVFTE